MVNNQPAPSPQHTPQLFSAFGAPNYSPSPSGLQQWTICSPRSSSMVITGAQGLLMMFPSHVRQGLGPDGREGTGSLLLEPAGTAMHPHGPTDSKDFAQQRKMHYSEGKALKPQKNLPLEDNMAGQGPSANVSSSGHQVTLSPEPLPLQRSEAAEQASIGVKGEQEPQRTSSRDSRAQGPWPAPHFSAIVCLLWGQLAQNLAACW